MRIGLYLQDYRQCNKATFNKAVSAAKRAAIDLLVFPENCYTPYQKDYYFEDILQESSINAVFGKTSHISRDAGCAVILGGTDSFGMIYSVFANAYSGDNEQQNALYLKHTMADDSPLALDDYLELAEHIFQPVLLKGKRLGMTICYDCNHSAFSRAYCKNGLDILINTTGGNVVYEKWYRYNKVRAIENKCFNFCTMGYENNGKENSYVFGFTPNGKLMEHRLLLPGKEIGNIAVYDSDSDDLEYEDDIHFEQRETISKDGDYFINVNKIDELLLSAKKIENNVCVLKTPKHNLIVCTVEGSGILAPECVLRLLYNQKLRDIPNKAYLIVNRWSGVEPDYFRTILSDVLRVRAMENFCAVLFISGSTTKCYQCSRNKASQVVASINGGYTLALTRMGGPESIWKNKLGMRGTWRKGYEQLIDYIAHE